MKETNIDERHYNKMRSFQIVEGNNDDLQHQY